MSATPGPLLSPHLAPALSFGGGALEALLLDPVPGLPAIGGGVARLRPRRLAAGIEPEAWAFGRWRADDPVHLTLPLPPQARSIAAQRDFLADRLADDPELEVEERLSLFLFSDASVLVGRSFVWDAASDDPWVIGVSMVPQVFVLARQRRIDGRRVHLGSKRAHRGFTVRILAIDAEAISPNLCRTARISDSGEALLLGDSIVGDAARALLPQLHAEAVAQILLGDAMPTPVHPTEDGGTSWPAGMPWTNWRPGELDLIETRLGTVARLLARRVNDAYAFEVVLQTAGSRRPASVIVQASSLGKPLLQRQETREELSEMASSLFFSGSWTPDRLQGWTGNLMLSGNQRARVRAIAAGESVGVPVRIWSLPAPQAPSAHEALRMAAALRAAPCPFRPLAAAFPPGI